MASALWSVGIRPRSSECRRTSCSLCPTLPIQQAFVLSRGIVGSKGDRLKVALPIYKQDFDLRTGQCLDDPSVSIPTFEVRVVECLVQVALP